MKKKHFWRKTLTAFLILAVALGCFSGCGRSGNPPANTADMEEIDPRDGLVKCKWNGLVYYLGEKFRNVETKDSVIYRDEENDIGVTVMACRVSEDIQSAEDWMNQNDFFQDDSFVVEERGKANGVPYFYGTSEANEMHCIAGFYYRDGYGWSINVHFKKIVQKDVAIRYATLGEIVGIPSEQNESVGEDEESNNEVKTVVLTVWTSEEKRGENSWLMNRLNAFQELHPRYQILWNTETVADGDAANQLSQNPDTAADVYLFANDQLEILREYGALTPLDGNYLDQVMNDNTPFYVDTVTAADGRVYGFPVSGNNWFMYYNKDVYTEEDVKSLDSMLKKGVVAMAANNSWYNQSFFTANGCTLFGDHGYDASAGIQFGGQKGYDAAKAMIGYFNHKNFDADLESNGVSGLIDGSIHAIFSGWWDYEYLKEAMGDSLGCAVLPYITVADCQVQMKAFGGSKVLGVNPNSSHGELAMELAAFLASEESQLLRFEMSGVVPSHKNLAVNEKVLADDLAAVQIAVMNSCVVVQPVLHQMSMFWVPMSDFGKMIAEGDVTVNNYKEQVDALNTLINEQES